MNILIVRLGALGDIIHTVPAAAALRAAFPSARIDWLVDAKHRAVVDLVTVIDRVVVLERPSLPGWIDVARRLRAGRYDVALDFQGLMKSAVLARASGAPRVIGFSIWHLREKTARPFYSEIAVRGEHPADASDACDREKPRLLHALGVDGSPRSGFRLRSVESPALTQVARGAGRGSRLRADQSRRGMAEQALAAGSIRRGRGVPPRRPRSSVGRAVGTGRRGTRRRGRGRIGRRGPRRAADRAAGSARASPRRRTDGVGRHRAAAHRGRRRHADGVGVWSDRPVTQRAVGGRRCGGLALRACGCHYERRCHKPVVPRRRLRSRRSPPRFSNAWRRTARHRSRSRGLNDCCCAARATPRAIGFVSAVSRLWLAQPTPRSLAIGAVRRGGRRSHSHLGGGAPRERTRGHDVRAVRAYSASALSRVGADRDRICDRIGERDSPRRWCSRIWR